MKSSEIPQKNTFADFLLEEIQTYRPDASLVMLEDQPMILLHTGMDLNLRSFQEKYFPDSGQPPNKENPYADAVWKDIGDCGVLPVNECAEITTGTGERVYVMPESEFKIIEKEGLLKRTHAIEFKINEWLRNHRGNDDFEKQKMAGRALTGDYSFIVPMLAGLKPAGDIARKNWRNKITQTSLGKLDCFNFFCELGVLGKIKITDDHWIYFNPKTVQKLYAQIGLDESALPEQAVGKILLALTKDDQLAGMLYGFDEYSVMHYEEHGHTSNHPNFPMSVWDLQYKVVDEEKNDTYRRLHSQYEEIFADVEKNLSCGMSPLDTLKSIVNFYEQRNICQKVRDSVSKV